MENNEKFLRIEKIISSCKTYEQVLTAKNLKWFFKEKFWKEKVNDLCNKKELELVKNFKKHARS